MVSAPTGTEDLAEVTATVDDVDLSTRSFLRSRVLHLDGLPVVELQDEARAITITPAGDRLMAAEQLEQAAGVLLAAAHELRQGRPGHRKVLAEPGRHQMIPWCECGQAWGHPNAAFS